MSEDIKRGPGRPKKELKRGSSSWQPASVTDVVNKEDGYRYRWLSKDAANLAKKEMEGWEIIGLGADSVSPADSGRINDGKNLTSIYEKHDVVLARLDEETAQQRDEWYGQKTEARTAGLTAHIKDEVRKEGSQTHGDITISSRKGTSNYN